MKSVLIFLVPVVRHGLLIMVFLTKRLPVVLVPEELRVTAVG